MEDPKPRVVSGLSMGDLRQKLHSHLRSNGSLGQLKTQLRSMILSEVMQSNLAASAGGAPSTATETWSSSIANAVVAQHLAKTRRDFTLSVFSSETALSAPLYEEAELSKMLCLNAEHGGSILMQLLESHDKRGNDGMQTSNVGVQVTADIGEPGLEQKLALIDAQFAVKYRSQRDATRLDYELHLSSFKASMESEMKESLVRQLQTFRTKELAEMRKDERQRYEVILNHKREEHAEMERTVRHRLELERTRIDQLRQDLDVRANDLDNRMRGAAASVQERDECIRQLEVQLRNGREMISRLRSDVARYEDVAVQRLQELEMVQAREQRRIDDIRRIQADNLLELRLRNDEIADLRSRLRNEGINAGGVKETLIPDCMRHNVPPVVAYPVEAPCTQQNAHHLAEVQKSATCQQQSKSPAATMTIQKTKTADLEAPKRLDQQLPIQPLAHEGEQHLSPERNDKESSIFDSPSLDRTGIDRQQTHLSQLSSIAAQHSLHRNTIGGVDSTNSTSHGDESNIDNSGGRAPEVASTITNVMKLQEIMEAEESSARLMHESEMAARRELLQQIDAEKTVGRIRAMLSKIMTNEESLRSESIEDCESTERKEIIWVFNKRKDELLALQHAPQYVSAVGANSDQVLFRSDSDDDASDLLFKKGSDSEESF